MHRSQPHIDQGKINQEMAKELFVSAKGYRVGLVYAEYVAATRTNA
jgi:hypothetical protein